MAVTAFSPVLLTVRCVDTQTDYVPVKQDGPVTTVRTVTFFLKISSTAVLFWIDIQNHLYFLSRYKLFGLGNAES